MLGWMTLSQGARPSRLVMTLAVTAVHIAAHAQASPGLSHDEEFHARHPSRNSTQCERETLPDDEMILCGAAVG